VVIPGIQLNVTLEPGIGVPAPPDNTSPWTINVESVTSAAPAGGLKEITVAAARRILAAICEIGRG
jgi:hypothetical protein